MAEEYTRAVQRLTDLLTEENTALKRLDFCAAVALVGAKESALADLTVSSRLPTSCKTLVQRLLVVAEENQFLLERAITMQGRIVRTIARAALPPPAVRPYDGHGKRAGSARAGAFALLTHA